MRNASQREVYFLEAVIEAEPSFGAVHTAETLMDDIGLLSLFDGGRHMSSNGGKVYHVDRVHKEEESEIYWLLLRINDRHGSNASFSLMEGGKIREVAKEAGEGRPLTCHVAFSLKETRKGSKSYIILLEECGLLKRDRLEWYLNAMLRRVSKEIKKYKVPHPSGALVKGEPKMASYHSVLTINGLVSDDFTADLEAGKLQGITLEKGATSQAPVGDGKTVRPNKLSLSMSAQGEWRRDPWQRIKDSLSFAKREKFDRARIHFSASAGNPSTAVLDTLTGNLVEDGYIKRGRLKNPAATWAEAESNFNPLVQHQMRLMLKEERGDPKKESE